MGAISELYHGRISAPTEITTDAEKYNDLNDRAEEIHERIKGQTSESLMGLVEELLDLHRQMEAITSEDSYCKGFRDGARIMLDSLND